MRFMNVPWLRTILFLPLLAAISMAATGPPEIQIVDVRRVFDNGEHNAFTDLVRYRDRYYLTFRSCPNGHGVYPTSSIIILASDDTKTWHPVHQFAVPLRDVRDPHFLVFQDKLFVYSGAWYCGEKAPEQREINEHLGFAVWTSDGATWQGPEMLEGTYGHYVWRAAARDGKAYLCGRRKRLFAKTATRAERDPLIESAMLESDDGLIWRKAALFQEHHGGETAFLFEADGSALAVANCGIGRNSQVLRANPALTQWTRIDLDRGIGGPMLARWNGHDLVGGRKTLNDQPRTTLYWLVGDTLREIAELPSAGDNSYPGFVQIAPDRAVVSYYSSHEKIDGKPSTNIYLAELLMLAD
ncbi:MAG: hypothetical protein JW829_06830 [Pirellulales bacterium]|nr:hypothetical protein [Pirellulales bacterium]